MFVIVKILIMQIRLVKPFKKCILALVLITLAAGSAFSTSEKSSAQSPSPSQGSDIALTGKFFCSLKRTVALPFKGTILSVRVQQGQRVEKGEVLATYRLAPEAILQIRQSLSSSLLNDVEGKIADLQDKLHGLKANQVGHFVLAQQGEMSSPLMLIQTNQKITNLNKQITTLSDTLRQEKQLAQDRLVLLREQLGTSISREKIPAEAYLKSPIQGQLIWTHPDLQNDAEPKVMEPLLEIGVMHPMLLRGSAFELDAIKLAPGDQAEVSFQSIPGLKFQAHIRQISWTPLKAALDQPSYYRVEFSVPNPDLIIKEGMKGVIVFPHKK